MGIIIWILSPVLNTILIITMINVILMGPVKIRLCKKVQEKEFLIRKKNRIDLQNNLECSAFSTSYVLRHLDIPAEGNDLYESMPNKMRGGYVYPKGIINMLKRYHIQADYCIGSINSLKREVTKGIPVIVLIRYQQNKSYLHYVPVVGFDEEYIFIADSLEELVNCNEEFYNRKVKILEFKKLWNTSMIKMPLYTHTYYVIKSNKERE